MSSGFSIRILLVFADCSDAEFCVRSSTNSSVYQMWNVVFLWNCIPRFVGSSVGNFTAINVLLGIISSRCASDVRSLCEVLPGGVFRCCHGSVETNPLQPSRGKWCFWGKPEVSRVRRAFPAALQWAVTHVTWRDYYHGPPDVCIFSCEARSLRRRIRTVRQSPGENATRQQTEPYYVHTELIHLSVVTAWSRSAWRCALSFGIRIKCSANS